MASKIKEAILIHGWDTHRYNHNLPPNPPENVAWKHRQEFISFLEKSYQLKYFNLPGFCGTSEPNESNFTLQDFSTSLHSWLKKEESSPSVIIGYSFGGAVALDHKIRFQDTTPIVLVSPALIRQETLKSKIAHRLKKALPLVVSNNLKSIYQTLFSRYYRQGSSFLKESYDQIVRQDLRPLLKQVNPEEILLIYGEQDTDTPWKLVEDFVEQNGLNYLLIPNGTHAIGQTHPEKITQAIENFIR